MKNRFTWALLTLLFISCSHDKSKEDPPDLCVYAPYTLGSVFKFVRTSGTASVPYTVTVTGDTVISGESYSVLQSEYGTQYIRCQYGNYYLFEPAIVLPGYTKLDDVQQYLHDDRGVGEEWNDTIAATVNGTAYRGVLKYRVLSREAKRIVLSHTYNNVISVQQDAYLIIDNAVYPNGTLGVYYYAKDVGFIESHSATDTIQLADYQIK
jgi:hypothetical protein